MRTEGRIEWPLQKATKKGGQSLDQPPLFWIGLGGLECANPAATAQAVTSGPKAN